MGLTFSTLLLGFLAGCQAVATPQDVKARTESYRKEFLDLQAARGLPAAQAARAAESLSGHTCASCHLGIRDPAFRLDEPLRRKGERRFTDPAVQREFERRYPPGAERLRRIRAFMAHPRLDLYVAPGSRHPLERFDCLSCHGADDRKRELKEREHRVWTNLYVRYHPELRQTPILLSKYAQSSCRSCHGAEARVLDGAEKLALGAEVLDATNCHACHRMPDHAIVERHAAGGDGRPDPHRIARRPGPPLTHLADKMEKDWAYSFLLSPDSFRPTTRMPRFFRRESDPPEQGPKFTGPENEVIAASIVEYLHSKSQTRAYAPPPFSEPATDEERERRSERGFHLAQQIGCTACHRFDTPQSFEFIAGRYSHHLEESGPTLDGAGDKFSSPPGRTWLYHWLKSPRHYFADTRMPDFRLSDEETRDLMAYLAGLKLDPNTLARLNGMRLSLGSSTLREIPLWEVREPPIAISGEEIRIRESYGEILETLVRDFLSRDLGGEARARPRLAAMRPKERVLWLGERMIEHFGCYSCHEIRDPARTGEREWTAMEPTGEPWSVKIFPGTGKFDRMPFSSLTELETEALYTYLMSYSSMGRPSQIARAPTAREQALHRGGRVIAAYGCANCHVMREETFLLREEGDAGRAVWCEGNVRHAEGDGLTVHWLADPTTLRLNPAQRKHASKLPLSLILDRRPPVGGRVIPQLQDHKRLTLGIEYEHEGHLWGRMSPSLRAEGARARPCWLERFLKEPWELRPMLRARTVKNRDGQDVEEFNVRMPTFPWKEHELEAVIAYFGALGPHEPDAAFPDPVARLEELKGAYALIRDQCGKCHVPEAPTPGPPLSFTEKHVRPAFLRSYLLDPLLHEPRSMMPAFRPGDERELQNVIDVLRSYARVEKLIEEGK